MSLFNPDIAAALQSARDSFNSTAAKIDELDRQRSIALASMEATAVDEVQRIDTEIGALRDAAAIYHERAAALTERQRQEDRQRLEREKAERIAEVAKRLARRLSAAKQVDAAAVALREAVEKLDRADAAVGAGSWYSVSTIGALADRAAGPADRLGLMEKRKIVGPLRGVANGAPFGLADAVEGLGASLIEHLQSEPIPEPEPEPEIDDDDIEEEVAA